MGSKSTQKTEVPAYIEEAGRLALERAKQIQAMGYVPYMGPEVAAVNPYEQAVAANVGGMASAFGLAAPAAMSMGAMPTVTQGGVTGYSSYPSYMASLERLREVRPEMYDYFSNLTKFDPITGALNPQYDVNMQAMMQPQVDAPTESGGGGGGSNLQDFMEANRERYLASLDTPSGGFDPLGPSSSANYSIDLGQSTAGKLFSALGG